MTQPHSSQGGSVRFLITRTSTYGDDQPCPEAVEGMAQSWDIRTIESPEAYDAKFGPDDKWHARGTEHQPVTGPDGEKWIRRRLEDCKAWFVEFSTLAELLAFQEKYGPLILQDSYGWPGQLAIDIYDDYRE